MDQQKRILIVDDEPNVRLMLKTALESVGYAVTRGRRRPGRARAAAAARSRRATWSCSTS